MAETRSKGKPDAPPQAEEKAAPDAASGVKRPASASGDSGTKKKVAADEKQTFKGSCHCGAIRYALDLDPAELNGSRCNCTFCTKLSLAGFNVKNPESDFKLVSPASKDKLADYAPQTDNVKNGIGDVHRYFCNKCGVHVWQEGWYKAGEDKFDVFTVNLSTIDQPQDGIDLSKFRFKYADGLHDNFFAEPADEAWSGGLP